MTNPTIVNGIAQYGRVHWEEDDIANALDRYDIAPTQENIDRIIDEINWSNLVSQMVEAGWNVIESTIEQVFNE